MEILEYAFFRNALAGVVLISVATAIIGTYIATRRMVFISGGITHACFGGLGLGYFLGISPLLMATVFAVGGSLGADWLSRRRVREDTAVGVIWALGMALGVLFIFLTPGHAPELNTFLFGNVLTITHLDLWLFAILLAVLLAGWAAFRRQIIAVSFDADFARTRHLPVRTIETVMTVLVAVTIVLTIRMIGIMLLMSLMTLPQITAELAASRYSSVQWTAALLSVAGGIGGLFLAYVISVPASAAIVLLLVAFYIVGSVIKKISYKRQSVRRLKEEA